MIELKDVQNKVFVDYSINRAKVELPNGKFKTIGFKVYFNDFGKYVFEVNENDEQYCVI